MTVIVFDLDNTLVDRVAAFQLWARSFVTTYGYDEQSVSTLVRLDGDGVVPRSEFFSRVGAELGTDAAVVSDDYLARYPLSFELDFEIPPFLDLLRQHGHFLLIATNGPPFQNDVICNTGLDKFVDDWVVSAVVGVRKPDIGILTDVQTRRGLTTAEHVVVGDGSADIELAHRLGARSIWIDRGRQWQHAEFGPTHVVSNVTLALRLLADDLC